MAAPEFTRRPDFDQITEGWGHDGYDDLLARCQLLAEWQADNFLTMAEEKVERAMKERLKKLGGIEHIPEGA